MTKVSPVVAGSLPVATPSALSAPAVSTSALSQPASTIDPAKIAKSAHDFEAMAISQLLQPMFDTVDTSHGLFGGGSGEEAWKPMLVQEFAKQIANHGGLGLAKPVYDAMIRMQENKSK
jgi:flagellar protein FlgJ